MVVLIYLFSDCFPIRFPGLWNILCGTSRMVFDAAIVPCFGGRRTSAFGAAAVVVVVVESFRMPFLLFRFASLLICTNSSLLYL